MAKEKYSLEKILALTIVYGTIAVSVVATLALIVIAF